MAARVRQEVLNVHLAHLLREAAVEAIAEVIVPPSPSAGRHMPDVLLDYRGLRVMIEAEIADAPNAEQQALQSARNRVENELAHIGLAVVYPPQVRAVEGDPSPVLRAATLRVATVTEEGDTPFVDARIPDVVERLAHAQAGLIKGEAIEAMVAKIKWAIDYFAITTNNYFGDTGRMTNKLGLTAGTLEEMQNMPQGERAELCRVAGLVLLNGLMFQELLADVNPRVPSNKPETNVVFDKDRICGIWSRIIEEINYFSVFHVAYDVLVQVGRRKPVNNATNALLALAKTLIENRMALRHDLAGRVYHTLLRHQKYLATYYTKIPAATLLLKLMIGRARDEYAFEDVAAVRNLRVADFACGTGTLLVAAAEACTDAHVRRSVQTQRMPERDALQQALLEDVLYGLDVLPAAVHLTASSLAMRAPHVPVARCHLYSVAHGGDERKLGSLELLRNGKLFKPLKIFTPDDISGFPDLDFCVMNPPFTRSVGGNMLFGSEGSESLKRTAMQEDLKALVKKKSLRANITAGLGAVFVALADLYLKPGGRMALVLPKAVLSGPAWKETRRLLQEKYLLEFTVCCHEPGRWNFSESTDLSETLLVARKLREGEDVSHARTVAVNLWVNPEKAVESLEIARGVLEGTAPDLETGQGALALFGSTGQWGPPPARGPGAVSVPAVARTAAQVGEAFSMPWTTVARMESWAIPSGFAQSDVARAALHLAAGRLWLPGFGVVVDLPVKPLGACVALGPDRRDIHDGFALSTAETSYPALWGNRSTAVQSMACEVNQYLRPRSEAAPRRPLRKVEDLWPKAGELMLAERLWLTTHRVAAGMVGQKALANVWWPCRAKRETRSQANLKSLCLWLNSTLGILSLLSVRVETRGPWICFKKPALRALPVPEVGGGDRRRERATLRAFDELSPLGLQPIAALGVDPVRARIDAAVCELLGLPDLSRLRGLLAREPILSGTPLHLGAGDTPVVKPAADS